MAVIIDFDKALGIGTHLEYEEDFRMCHPRLWVTWNSPDMPSVKTGDTVIFRGMEFTPVSLRSLSNNSFTTLSGLFYPACMLLPVTRLCLNFEELSKFFGLTTTADCLDHEFMFPLNNVLASPLVNKYRYQSFEENIDTPEDSSFMFFGPWGADCYRISSLSSRSKSELIPGDGTNYSYVGDQPLAKYLGDHFPIPTTYANWIDTIFGLKVEVKCARALTLGLAYTFSGLDTELSGVSDLVLVKQRFDSSNVNHPWTLVFSQMKFGGSLLEKLGRAGFGLPFLGL